VELVPPKNLEIRQTEGRENDGFQRLDSADTLEWAWYVKHDKATTSELKFRVYFRWKPKPNSGIPDNWPDKKVWPREDRTFSVSVYEPTIWNLMTKIFSWLSTGIGATLMSIIVGPWVKLRYKRWRKKRGRTGTAEDG